MEPSTSTPGLGEEVRTLLESPSSSKDRGVPKLDDRLRALVLSANGRSLPFAHLLWAGGVEVVYFSPRDENKGRLSDDGLLHAKSWRPHLSSAHFVVCDDPVMGRKCLKAMKGRGVKKPPTLLYTLDVSPTQAVDVEVQRKPWWKFWSN